MSFAILPKNVPIVPAMLRPIAPPDNESKLALRAQAHALVPGKLAATRTHPMNEQKSKRTQSKIGSINNLSQFSLH